MDGLSRAALEELARRESRWKPRTALFAQQVQFLSDRAKRKVGVCTRRAGKTRACSHLLLETCLENPGAICLYFALTRASAKRLIWGELNKLNAKHRLGIIFNITDLTATLPNGSQIILSGAENADDIEKWRGNAYHLVVIDEAGSFGPHIAALVEEVLEAALLDHDGTMVLVGTPTPRCAGWFYEAATDRSRGWSLHEWSILDNPHLPHARAYIEDLKKRRGWDEQTPAFLREFRGRWVRSDDVLVYHYDQVKNDFDQLPPGHVWSYVIGGDVGFRDRAAWSVLAWSETSPAAYFIHNETHAGLIPYELAQVWKRLLVDYPGAQCVMDCGALGLPIAEEFRTRYNLPIIAADKRDKLAGIELLNGDLRTGKIFARHNSRLTEEWQQLQFDPKVSLRDPQARREDPHMPNDAADSALYAYRFSRHYWHTPPSAKVAPEAEAAMDDRFQAQRRRETADPFAGYGPGDDEGFGPGARRHGDHLRESAGTARLHGQSPRGWRRSSRSRGRRRPPGGRAAARPATGPRRPGQARRAA